jgi:hypothetical protein
MITKNSIDLRFETAPCFALGFRGMCGALSVKNENCGTVKCPFYKPIGCKDWIRVEDCQGVHLVPPEEWRKVWRRYLHV